MFFAIFANPVYLAGLLAMASPVIIHLLAKRRAAEVMFPAFRFLRFTVDRTSSRRRLEELLLLALRAAALGTAALALSQPVILAIGAGRQQAMVVILDNSLSMQQDASGQSAWEAAKEAALHILAVDEPEGQANAHKRSAWALWFSCLQADDDPLRLMQMRTPEEAKLAIASAKITAGKGDLRRLLMAAATSLAKYPADARELYILTDGQASEWEEAAKDLAGISPRPTMRVFIYIPDGCGGPNLSVERLAVKMRAPLPGEEVRLEAEIRNWSRRLAETSVSFYLNGALVNKQGVSVPAMGKTNAFCAATLHKAGWQNGLVQIDADSLCRDNRRAFVLEVPEAAQILLCDGSGAIPSRERTALYLEAALAASPSMRVKRISTDALAAEDLAAYNAVFVVDTPAPSREDAAALRLFAKAGGTVIFAVGAGANFARWNEILGPGSDEQDGMLPAALHAAVAFDSEDGAALEAVEATHPLLMPFAAAMEQIRRAKIKKIHGLESPPRRGSRTALAAAGAPVIVSRGYGKGRVVLWTISLAPAWTNLAAKPIFVPLVLSHVYWALQKPEARGAIACQPLLVAQPAQTCEVRGNIRLPGGESLPIAGQAGPEQPLFFPHTAEDGIYTIELQTPVKERRLRAVNPTNADSNLARIDNRFLSERLECLGPTICVESAQALREEIKRARQGTALMDPLLFVAFAILLAEGRYAAGLRRPEKKHA